MATTAGRLTRAWESPNIVVSIITSVDHKQIAMRYIATAFIFFCFSGVDSLIIRSQLAVPDADVVEPERYNQIFTMHGTVMIFLFATPLLVGGFGNYLVPLMLGTRDMASDVFFVLLVPVAMMGLPIFDTTLVTIIRTLEGRPVSQGGRFVRGKNGCARGSYCSARSAVSIAAWRKPQFT